MPRERVCECGAAVVPSMAAGMSPLHVRGAYESSSIAHNVNDVFDYRTFRSTSSHRIREERSIR
jgi:hypothetical protein